MSDFKKVNGKCYVNGEKVSMSKMICAFLEHLEDEDNVEIITATTDPGQLPPDPRGDDD